MKRYPKPKTDDRGEPEYWNKENPPEYYSNDDYVYSKVYSIDNVEEKVIYLNWLKDEYLPKNAGDQWEFYYTMVKQEIDEAMKGLKDMMGNKRFAAVDKNNDFKISNDFYGKQSRMSLIIYPSESFLVDLIIRFIGSKNLIYLKAMEAYYLSGRKISFVEALDRAQKRFKILP